RQGQPTFDQVDHIEFYDDNLGLEKSIEKTSAQIDELVAKDKYCALKIEMVQGEGGFNFAPDQYYQSIFEKAKSLGLAIWIDEVQTFGRTGELFAFQKFNCEKYPDVVTVGKLSQACFLLFSEQYNPKPGLVAGTFS